MSIGEKIKDERRKKKISRKKLAILLGTTPKTVENWEKGKEIVDAENLIKLSTQLGMDFSDIAQGAVDNKEFAAEQTEKQKPEKNQASKKRLVIALIASWVFFIGAAVAVYFAVPFGWAEIKKLPPISMQQIIGVWELDTIEDGAVPSDEIMSTYGVENIKIRLGFEPNGKLIVYSQANVGGEVTEQTNISYYYCNNGRIFVDTPGEYPIVESMPNGEMPIVKNENDDICGIDISTNKNCTTMKATFYYRPCAGYTSNVETKINKILTDNRLTFVFAKKTDSIEISPTFETNLQEIMGQYKEFWILEGIEEGKKIAENNIPFDYSSIIPDYDPENMDSVVEYLWKMSNKIYNVDCMDFCDGWVSSDGVNIFQDYFVFSNYYSTVKSIFTQFGIEELEKAKIEFPNETGGSRGALYIVKRLDGTVLHLSTWKTGVFYEDAIITPKLISDNPNRKEYSIQYKLTEKDDSTNTVRFIIKKCDDGRWRVDSYEYPEANYSY